jgi:transposase
VRPAPDAIKALVEELSAGYDRVTMCYEAGACGFELYRRITDLGALCIVIAPSSLPKKANDRIKTDRRDAVKLAMGLRSGELSPVYVPTREDEALRDYLRAYEDIKAELKRAKQRLVHFFLRHEIRCEDAKNWSAKYWTWLRSLTFDSPMMALAFEEYVGQITRLEETRKRIADRLEAVAAEEQYETKVKTLRAFKGIGTLTALSFIVEIGDFRRFARAEQFMAFLGLVPSEYSSGGQRRLGSITKTGNGLLRKLLIEAAWHARYCNVHGKTLLKDRAVVSPEIAAYADRAGKRLNRKYWRLLNAKRPHKSPPRATDSQIKRGRTRRPRETCRKRAGGSRETSIAPASVPSAVAMTTLAGADATGSAKKKSMEVRARAEVDPAILSRDDHGRGTVQFTEDSSRPGGARPTLMR